MPSRKSNYSLNTIKQLIDLNGDIVNFNLNFTVTSKDRVPFYLVAVDQTVLDNNEELDYKLVETGKISGNIISDSNIHQNYYLVMKSAEKPCVVAVEIDIEEVPPNIHYNQPVFDETYPPPNEELTAEHFVQDHGSTDSFTIFGKTVSKNTLKKYIIYTLVIAFIIGLSYYLYKKYVKKSDNDDDYDYKFEDGFNTPYKPVPQLKSKSRTKTSNKPKLSLSEVLGVESASENANLGKQIGGFVDVMSLETTAHVIDSIENDSTDTGKTHPVKAPDSPKVEVKGSGSVNPLDEFKFD